MLGTRTGSWPDSRDADSGVSGHQACVWAAGLADPGESAPVVVTPPSSALNRPCPRTPSSERRREASLQRDVGRVAVLRVSVRPLWGEALVQ